MTVVSKISRCFSPFFALMILISSMSYTIDFHYCQGKLKSYSLFGEAKNCHDMAEKKATCPHHQAKKISESACAENTKNCCQNETIHFESDIDKQISNAPFLSTESQAFVLAFSLSSATNTLEVVESEVPFTHYKPPLINKDIPVLFERFLI